MSTEIDNEYSKYDNVPLVELVHAMSTMQNRKEALEDQLKIVNKEFDFLRITKIPAKMEEDGVDRINVTGIGRVSLTADMHVSVKADQKAEFFTWLRDNGRGDLCNKHNFKTSYYFALHVITASIIINKTKTICYAKHD